MAYGLVVQTPCLPWGGSINDQGYGRLGSKLAHRVEWEKVHGPIPPGITLDHLCHDPNVCRLGRECPHRRCVNVEHLALAEHGDNASRGWRRMSLIQNCPKGHPYSGANLAIYNGERHCRTCRRDQGEARRSAQRVKRCRARGHERRELVARNGKRYCEHCSRDHGRRASATRARTEGRFA